MKLAFQVEFDPATGKILAMTANNTEAVQGAKSDASSMVFPYHSTEYQHTFQTQAEYEDFLRRLRERDANLVEWGRAFEAKGEVLEAGQIDCRTFNTNDLYFFWVFGAELTAYVGPRAAENRMITYADVGAFPQGEFPYIGRVDQALLRGGFDWQAYQGPLRALLAKHRGVSDI